MTRHLANLRYHLSAAELDMPVLSSAGFHAYHKTIPLRTHVHEGVEVTYVAKGEVTWDLDGRPPLHLTGGQVALVQPGVEHRGQWGIIRPCDLFWLVLDLDSPEARHNTVFSAAEFAELRTGLEEAGNSVCRADAVLRDLFEGLLDAMAVSRAEQSDALVHCETRALICRLLVRLVRHFQHGKRRPAPSAECAEAAIAFMTENLTRNISVPDIAQHLGISPARLSDQFRMETGLTPADYLQRLRCERARELLRETPRTVTDIAFALGFSSSQYFARVFRKYTGISPTAFRAANRTP